jgi:predicted esterase
VSTRTELIEVPRTARYVLLGAGQEGAVAEVWFAIHGMSQLAASFARRFEPIASPTRLVVVPEALSRYYLAPAEAIRAGEVRVGASWMTREARDLEITDHVRYLDLLWAHLTTRYTLDTARVTVLGFSQGVATIGRWLARSTIARADAVILWGGKVPPDILPLAEDSPLRRERWTMVVGDRDDFATPEVVAEERARLAAADLDVAFVSFAGGHAIDPDTLARLAAAPQAEG